MSQSVLVTGAAGGIGSALVKLFASSGWEVLGSDHPDISPPPSIHRLCCGWIPANLENFVQDEEQLNNFQSKVLLSTKDNPLTAIIHNAALQQLGSFCDLTNDDWYKTYAVNVLAPVAISRSLMPELRKNRGSIVHIGSIHSSLTKSGFTAYASSKSALAGLVRAMSVELGGYVRVNGIEPAAISTPMLEAGFSENPQLKSQLESFHPTGAIGSPEDVARSVLFLVNSKNRFLNGCLLPLGGGIHNRLHDPV